jgi:hypothetical protein
MIGKQKHNAFIVGFSVLLLGCILQEGEQTSLQK